jgi:hypothetical protein
MSNSVDNLCASYASYCHALGVKATLQTEPQHDGSPHFEMHQDKYHFVVTERGSEFERRITKSEDEILYWFLSCVVFGLACNYELNHRVSGQSFRRLLFSKEVDLMDQLNPNWADIKRQEIETILSENPFDDLTEG